VLRRSAMEIRTHTAPLERKTWGVWRSYKHFAPLEQISAFGALEDRVADFGAVGNRQHTNFLTLAPVFQQD
jgi:hypothetical protein